MIYLFYIVYTLGFEIFIIFQFYFFLIRKNIKKQITKTKKKTKMNKQPVIVPPKYYADVLKLQP